MQVLEDKSISNVELTEGQAATLLHFWTEEDDARLAKSLKDTTFGYFLALKVNKKDKIHTKYGAPVFTLVWDTEPLCEACIKGLHKQCKANYHSCIKPDEEINVYFVPPSDSAVRTATELRWRKASQVEQEKKPTTVNVVFNGLKPSNGYNPAIQEEINTPPEESNITQVEEELTAADLEEFGSLLNGNH